jgi:hypothetical protein
MFIKMSVPSPHSLKENTEMVAQIRPGPFLPQPFQFIVHNLSFHAIHYEILAELLNSPVTNNYNV